NRRGRRRRARSRGVAGVEGAHRADDAGDPERRGGDRQARRRPQGPRARAGRLPPPAGRPGSESLLEARRARDPSLARARRRLHLEEAPLMRYAAVLFDLFDTLVRFDRERMPEIQINGKTVRSSAGMLHAILKTQAPHIQLEACYEALSTSWREAERLRALDHREVAAPVRFAHFFRSLGLDEAALPPGFGLSLIDAHRADMDVLGAQQIGMDAAWINRDGEKLPAGVAPPTYEIRDLGELAGILGVGSSI